MINKSNNICFPEYKDGGVYVIINKTNKKIYVGETENIRSRSKAHINLLKTGKHYCKEMQKDYDNKNKFIIKIVLKIPGQWEREKRLCAEDYYISCFREKGAVLYNDQRDKNCKDNFFILASRLDANVFDVLNEINTQK